MALVGACALADQAASCIGGCHVGIVIGAGVVAVALDAFVDVSTVFETVGMGMALIGAVPAGIMIRQSTVVCPKAGIGMADLANAVRGLVCSVFTLVVGK